MKSELINLIFEYEKNRETPDREQCWNNLLAFLKEKKCTESNLELDNQIKDLLKEFHKISKSVDDSKDELHNYVVNCHRLLPYELAEKEQRPLEHSVEKNVKKLDEFLHSNGVTLIRTLLKELEIATAENQKNKTI